MTFIPVRSPGGEAPLGAPTQPRPGPLDPLLRVEHLRVAYDATTTPVVAVDDVSFEIARGGSMAILGESGSGKTSLGLALIGLNQGRTTKVDGSVRLDDLELVGRRREELEDIRGARIAMIFQDPLSTLNPVKRVGDQVAETFTRHRGLSARQAREAAVDTMARARIPDPRRRASDYPHQFSGGMRQRVMIAIAIALGPQLLIADEPTTALDVTVQAQIVQLLIEIRAETGMALILISHDLGLAAALADDVLVMYGGRMAEKGPLRTTYEHAGHPYTRGLLASAPRNSVAGSRLPVIPGSPPRLDQVARGCPFAPRCPDAIDLCRDVMPLPRTIAPGHVAACHLASGREEGR